MRYVIVICALGEPLDTSVSNSNVVFVYIFGKLSGTKIWSVESKAEGRKTKHCTIQTNRSFLGLNSLALPVLAHSRFLLWLVSISDDGSLPEMTLSDASKLASTLYF